MKERFEEIFKGLCREYGFGDKSKYCTIEDCDNGFLLKYHIPRFCSIYFCVDPDRKILFDGSIGVAHGKRKNGIGSKLLHVAEEFCRRAGIEYFLIIHQVNSLNNRDESDPHFFEKRGFRTADEETRNLLSDKFEILFRENSMYKRLI